jgi:hypothetical protein
MKNFIITIKNAFHKKNKAVAMPSVINPHKHWKMLLWSFLIVVSFLIIFSLYLLYKIKKEQIFQSSSANKNATSILKENLLKNVTDSFDKKTQKESDLITNPPVFSDPSVR